MRSKSSRSSRERVEAARRQAELALGRDPDHRDAHVDPKVAGAPAEPSRTPADSTRRDPIDMSGAVIVLTVSEAAQQLGLSRSQLDAMVARGAVKALPTGFTVTIPVAEVERLKGRMI